MNMCEYRIVGIDDDNCIFLIADHYGLWVGHFGTVKRSSWDASIVWGNAGCR